MGNVIAWTNELEQTTSYTYDKLDRLKNLPDRSSKAPYRGNPEILVGLSIGLANPVTTAVVNVRTGDVLTYRTPRTLLGDRYRLLNRHRTKQQQNTLQHQKNQKLGIAHQPSESELGEYVDRLLANEINDLVFTVHLHLDKLIYSLIAPQFKLSEPLSCEKCGSVWSS